MPGLLRGLARTAAIAGTATAVSNRVSRRQRGRWARKDQDAAERYEAEQYPPQYQSAQYQNPQYQNPQYPAGPYQGQPQYQAAPASGGGMDDTIAQLKQLAELKSQGVLSEAEFEQQKRRILGS